MKCDRNDALNASFIFGGLALSTFLLGPLKDAFVDKEALKVLLYGYGTYFGSVSALVGFVYEVNLINWREKLEEERKNRKEELLLSKK